MKGIFKHENVYVYIDVAKDCTTSVDDACILLSETKKANTLYGGRVELAKYWEEVYLTIDGIEIRLIKEDASTTYKLSFCQATAYLNQIENLGVDTFLENYRLQLQQLKQEMEKFAEDLQQELAVNYDETKAKKLSKYRKFILDLACILFMLFINMNAGLDNQQYINAAETIMNTYF